MILDLTDDEARAVAVALRFGALGASLAARREREWPSVAAAYSANATVLSAVADRIEGQAFAELIETAIADLIEGQS